MAVERFPPEQGWIVALHLSPDDAVRRGTGVLVADDAVLTAAHVLHDLGEPSGGPWWISFPMLPGGSRLRFPTAAPVLSDPEHDLALLPLPGFRPPPGAAPAPVRRPAPSGLRGKTWWAYGFPDGYPRGNDAFGQVGAALADGCVRIDSAPASESRYRLMPGFSGAGLWSPDYEAVVGIVITAGDQGDGEAVTLHQADLCFPGHELGARARQSAADAGEAAMNAWGWSLDGDPEAGRHWRPRARGVTRDGERGHRFQGRTAALRRIVRWLDERTPAREALVVTGSPGAGKSAVLGRVVTTADPVLRRALPPEDQAVRAPVGSVSCAVHAKGKTALEVAVEIARAASADLPERPDDLVPAVRRALGARREATFTVVLDALDEAHTPDEARLIVGRLLLPLVEECGPLGVRVVIGSRRHDDAGALLPLFGSARVIDLDDPAYFEQADLVAYTLATLRLSGAERPGNPYDDPAAALPVAVRIAESSNQNFLVAGLTALGHGLHDQAPVSVAALSFGPGVEDALDAYLRRLPRQAGVPADALLTALAYADVPGLPADLWAVAVHALTGQRIDPRVLAEFARSSAANFLVETGDHTTGAVYRLFHQALNDTLLGRRPRPADDHRALTRAFLHHGRAGGWAAAPDYLLRSLPAHARQAGLLDDLLTDDVYLLHADLRRLLLVTGRAVTEQAGRRLRLLRLTPEALDLSPPERASALSVAAVLQGLPDTFTRHQVAPYKGVWATTRPSLERAVLRAHSRTVQGVCAVPDPDGRTLLASASEDRTVRIWDATTGTLITTLTGHTGGVWGVCALSGPDGETLLASASIDQTVRIWDAATGTLVNTLTGHTGGVWGVCAVPVPDGRTLLASASTDCTVRIWDAATGIPITTLTGHTSGVWAVCALSGPDGETWIASASTDCTVRIWDAATGTPVTTLAGHTHGVLGVCPIPGPDGRTLLASASADRTVRIWDAATGTLVTALTGHTHVIQAVCAVPDPDGRTLLASASTDRTVRIWDATTGALLHVLTGHTHVIQGVCAVPDPDGRSLLASASIDHTVRIWDVTIGTALHTLTGHTSGAWGVCALPGPDGRTLLASASEDDIVRIWDAATGAFLNALTGHTNWVWAVCPLPGPDGETLLASVSADHTVRIWDAATGTALHVLTDHTNGVRAACALPGPDGRTLLASASDDHTVRIWDAATGTPVTTLTGHTSGVRAVCVIPDPDGRTLLASASDDGTVRIWDTTTGAALRVLTGHGHGVWGVCALPGPDGETLLASASADCTVRIWDAATGTPVTTLTGHANAVRAVCVIPGANGTTLLASASDDHTVRVWDMAAGRVSHIIPTHHQAMALFYVSTLERPLLVSSLSGGLLAVDLTHHL